MKDFENNIYNSVIIETHELTVENLKTRHYLDGSYINNGDCVLFNNDSLIKDSHGALYASTALQGNLIPVGWHIPTIEEWQMLIDYFFVSPYSKNSSSPINTSTVKNPISNTITYSVEDIMTGYNWTVVGCPTCGGTKPAPTIISGGGINDNFIEIVLNTKTSKISVEYLDNDLIKGFTTWEYRVVKNPIAIEEFKCFSNVMNGMSLGNGINVNHNMMAYYWVAPTIDKPSQCISIGVTVFPKRTQTITKPDGSIEEVTMPETISAKEWKFIDVPIGAACSIKCIKD